MAQMSIAPTKLFLAITNRCNVKCAHCMPDSRNSLPHELPSARWLSILDEAADLGVPRVAFTGGEPTLHPDLTDFIHKASSLGMRVDVETSASTYKRGYIDSLISNGLKVLCLSLDSPDRHGHDSFRGVPHLFNKVLDAAREAVAAGIDVRVYTTVTRNNLEVALNVADLFHDFVPPIRGLTFAPLTPIGRGATIATERPTAPEWQAFCKEFEAKRLQLAGRPNMRIEPMYSRKEELLALSVQYPQNILCIARERRYLYVNPQGHAYGCALLTGSDATLGNLRGRSLSSVWISSDGWDFFEPTMSCSSTHGCGGGCRALAYRTTGERLGRDYRCLEVGDDATPICPMVQVPMLDEWPATHTRDVGPRA